MSEAVHHAYLRAVAEDMRVAGWPVVEYRAEPTLPRRGWVCFDSLAEGLERSDRAFLVAWDEENGWSMAKEDWDQPGLAQGSNYHFGTTPVPTVAQVLDVLENEYMRHENVYMDPRPPRYRRHTDRDDLPGQLARALESRC